MQVLAFLLFYQTNIITQVTGVSLSLACTICAAADTNCYPSYRGQLNLQLSSHILFDIVKFNLHVMSVSRI